MKPTWHNDGTHLHSVRAAENQNGLEQMSLKSLVSPKMATASLSALSPKFCNSKSPKRSLQNQRNTATCHPKRNECSPTLRREILKGLAVIPLTLIKEPPSSEAREVEVGSYLPPSPSDPSFVFFKASPKDTPALRAGTLLF